jgi:prolyl oligopeptidase
VSRAYPVSYPRTRKVDQVDEYHGTKVADPFRWLEQPADTPEVRAWIEAQNAVTSDYLASTPLAAEIRARLTELWNYPRAGAPFRRGERYFQFRNSGLRNQDVLYVMDGPRDAGRILLDANELSPDGRVALVQASPSPDGTVLAYALSEGGSDWITWRFREVEGGRDLPDELEWSKFSRAAWHPDGSGVFYQRFPSPGEDVRYIASNEAPELRYHRLGSDQAADELVYGRPDEPEWMFHPAISDDDRFLLIHVSRSTEPRNMLLLQPLAGGEPIALVAGFQDEALYLGSDGDTFYLKTDRGGGRGKVVAVDRRRPQQWREVVPESAHLLEQGIMVGNEFLLLYQEDASHRLRRFSIDGEPRGEARLPGLGSVAALNAERDHDEAFFLFTSFLEPAAAYRMALPSGSLERLTDPALSFDAGAYVTRRLSATSPDGTRVPMFVVHHRELAMTGDHPVLLYGYGGFNISQTPVFSVSRLAWLERGGVLAVANLRGGGEYGREWHEAGTLERKQNVFDDFTSCAEKLIADGFTRPARLAIWGGSNGGLLVGACITQRPELFGAAHAAVGVMDMLRYHLFTIGSRWASDYGRADDPGHFPFLHAYSPLHNLSRGECYPATLITTGDRDDRVVPAHSFKFAAALQEAQGCDQPVLLRVETRAGHGMGKPTDVLIAEQADIWAFLLRELAVEPST